MAKKEEKSKIVLERTYNVPLRREFIKVPKYKKSKKAINGLKAFLIRHMKPGVDEKGRLLLKIGKHLNEHIWERGMKNPPHHVKIVTTKDEKGLVFAELEGAPVEKAGEKKEAEKEERKPAAPAKKEETQAARPVKKEAPKAPVKETGRVE